MRTRAHGTLFTSHTATRLPYSPLSAAQGEDTSPHLHAHTLYTQTSLMRTSHINHYICSAYVHKPHTYHACTHINTIRLSRTAPGPYAALALMGHPKWPLKAAALPIRFLSQETIFKLSMEIKCRYPGQCLGRVGGQLWRVGVDWLSGNGSQGFRENAAEGGRWREGATVRGWGC